MTSITATTSTINNLNIDNNNNNSNNIKANEEYNLLFERIKQVIESSAFTPLDKYTSQTLKHFDAKNKKTFFNFNNNSEHLNKITKIINFYRIYYVQTCQQEIETFFSKYNLQEKLTFNSEATVMDKLFKELKLDVKDMNTILDLNLTEEKHILDFYLLLNLRNKNKEIVSENEKLKEELEILKKQNNLNLN